MRLTVCKKVSLYGCFYNYSYQVVFLGETVLEKVEEIGKKLDELRDFLEDV